LFMVGLGLCGGFLGGFVGWCLLLVFRGVGGWFFFFLGVCLCVSWGCGVFGVLVLGVLCVVAGVGCGVLLTRWGVGGGLVWVGLVREIPKIFDDLTTNMIEAAKPAVSWIPSFSAWPNTWKSGEVEVGG